VRKCFGFRKFFVVVHAENVEIAVANVTQDDSGEALEVEIGPGAGMDNPPVGKYNRKTEHVLAHGAIPDCGGAACGR
jgi:hypothetical protein